MKQVVIVQNISKKRQEPQIAPLDPSPLVGNLRDCTKDFARIGFQSALQGVCLNLKPIIFAMPQVG